MKNLDQLNNIEIFFTGKNDPEPFFSPQKLISFYYAFLCLCIIMRQ